jgi:hypothetical protein
VRQALAVVAALAVAGAWVEAAPSPAAAPGRAAPVDDANGPFFADGAQFAVECAHATAIVFDPIAGATHLHDFFGTVEPDDPTTCRQRTDSAAYWAPALLRDGAPVEPLGATAYYRVAPGVDPASVVAPPAGMAMVSEVAAWACGRGGAPSGTPPPCPPEAPLQVRITFPDCWDGERLDSDDHHAHVAFSGPAGCEGDHDVALARLTLVVHYPVHGDPAPLSLSSGDPTTAHADFLNRWDQDALEREVRSCLHRAVVCGIPESSRAARGS